MQQISTHWDELMDYCNTIEVADGSCEGDSPQKFCIDTVDNNMNRESFFASNPCWYHTSLRIGIVCTGGFCEGEIINSADQNWVVSTQPQDTYQFGILYHPLVRFVSMLKYANYSIIKNVTGHFRGTYVVGEQMISDILKNDTNWYMRTQSELLENVNHIIHHNCILYEKKTDEELGDINFWLKHNLMNYTMYFSSRGNYHFDNFQDRHRNAGEKRFWIRDWNRWIDRHLDLEMSAWHFIIENKELSDLLYQRYRKDFELGCFESMKLTYDEYYG
tara:strand:+ start:109 stop:933 length:825 start_codon:yes stop_codon:yes gene_type:complete